MNEHERAERMARLMDQLEQLPDGEALARLDDLARTSPEDAEAMLALARQRAAHRHEQVEALEATIAQIKRAQGGDV
jgi:hypothetical protein